jgi:hypothetical protein
MILEGKLFVEGSQQVRWGWKEESDRDVTVIEVYYVYVWKQHNETHQKLAKESGGFRVVKKE